MEGKAYAFCMGITLDGNYAEQTCKRRENCQYYLEDLFRRHPAALDEGEMILNEPCKACTCYLPRKKEVEKRR